jgi:hypothetical protein
VRSAITAAGAAGLLLFIGATTASADPPPPPDYRTAVQEAYAAVQNAAPNDAGAAQKAAAALRAGTGATQPEILSDLEDRVPDLKDAATRLKALLTALDHPAATTDPVAANLRLRGVLSMHRYDALHRPPSLLDRVTQWINDRINQLLDLLFGGRGGSRVPLLYFYGVGLIVLAAIAFLVFRSTRGRFTQGVLASAPSGPRAPSDYFADADRLAAAGDRVGAIRALCAGVAATLAGERTWEGSPLTVREIFRRSPDPARLRPLLEPFEAAIYGGREVDAEIYERASSVAAPFRPARQLAA